MLKTILNKINYVLPVIPTIIEPLLLVKLPLSTGNIQSVCNEIFSKISNGYVNSYQIFLFVPLPIHICIIILLSVDILNDYLYESTSSNLMQYAIVGIIINIFARLDIWSVLIQLLLPMVGSFLPNILIIHCLESILDTPIKAIIDNIVKPPLLFILGWFTYCAKYILELLGFSEFVDPALQSMTAKYKNFVSVISIFKYLNAEQATEFVNDSNKAEQFVYTLNAKLFCHEPDSSKQMKI